MNLIRVKVITDAKKPSLVERSPRVVTLSVREPASDNRANKAVLQALADFYRIPKNKLRIISGHQKPSKLVEEL